MLRRILLPLARVFVKLLVGYVVLNFVAVWIVSSLVPFVASRSISLRVIDEQTGSPISEAHLRWLKYGRETSAEGETDSTGNIRLSLTWPCTVRWIVPTLVEASFANESLEINSPEYDTKIIPIDIPTQTRMNLDFLLNDVAVPKRGT